MNKTTPKAVSHGSLRHAVVKRLRFRKKLNRLADSTPFDLRKLSYCADMLMGYGKKAEEE